VPAFYKRRKRRGDEIGQLLLRRGVTPQQLREALKIQEEEGGHVGAILIRMGACKPPAVASALLEQVQLARGKKKFENLAERARANPSIVGLEVRTRPRLTQLLIMATDSFVCCGSLAAGWLIAGDPGITLNQAYGIAAIGLVTVATFAAAQMYGSTPPSPPEEIRRSTLSITIVCLGFLASALLGHLGLFGKVELLSWLLGWALAVLLVPIARAALRARFARRAWWGGAVVVLGAGKVGRSVVRTLQQRPQLGFKPVAVLDDNPARHGTLRASFGENDIDVESVRQVPTKTPSGRMLLTGPDDMDSPSMRAVWGQFSQIEGVPVVGGLELAPVLSHRLRIRTAVLAMPEMDTSSLLAVIERYGGNFADMLVVPDIFNLTHFGAPTRDLGGVLGIEVRRQLLLRGPRLAKRAMDIALTSVGMLFISPILLAIALAIKVEGGPIFYRQRRLGQDGVRFSALKFRTMYGDGEQRLQDLLERDPELRAEYELYHKLTEDPRVTRAGKVLRKYSLDELPQLWNVLVGEMSLVGPRPYLEREITDMHQQEAIILRAKPGMTGIWQVTERNATTFDHRVQLDVDYVRNWSPWLDIYLVARTIPVVLGGTGS